MASNPAMLASFAILLVFLLCITASGIVPGGTAATQSLPQSGNPIDDCWMGGLDWASSRHSLARCARGYGKDAKGGWGGRMYVVTTTDDHPVNPPYGSLRYGATMDEPLWIVFAGDMTFTLRTEIVVNSFKTIDARGAKVTFLEGPCLHLVNASNVIIHGVNFVRCSRRLGIETIRVSSQRLKRVGMSTGDAITVEASSNIWIDHCLFDSIREKKADKHIVVKLGSTLVTISNSRFRNMNKVILLGHSEESTVDTRMRVTVMLNYFGDNLVQRMPRCRFGKFHVVNNFYANGWKLYAIGGSSSPVVLSEGNVFVAATATKEVVRRPNTSESKEWSWRSKDDSFFLGATFDQSGSSMMDVPYAYEAIPAHMVPSATLKAGPLVCIGGSVCA